MSPVPRPDMPTRRPASTALPGVIDVEASGFGRDSYPIEVGFVLPDGGSYCSLIRPAPHWTHWDEAAERMHGISRAQLQRHGRDVDEVAHTLNDRLRGLTLYTDGWAHDYPWLAALFDAADATPRFRLENLRSVLSDDEAVQWHHTKDLLDAELGLQRHRASADARLLQMTVQRLRSADPAAAL